MTVVVYSFALWISWFSWMKIAVTGNELLEIYA